MAKIRERSIDSPRALHIVNGTKKYGHIDDIKKKADARESVEWTINSSAKDGDIVGFYIKQPVSSFVAVGEIEGEHYPNLELGWPEKWNVMIGKLRMLDTPLHYSLFKFDGWHFTPNTMSQTIPEQHQLPFFELLEPANGIGESELAVNFLDQELWSQETGAGFGDPKKNKEVEVAAVSFVRQDYEEKGWKVISKEIEKCGYDLLCEIGTDIEHVEVKGVSGSLESVIITRNEVEYLETPLSVVCIVTSALTASKLTKYAGAEFKNKFKLVPYSYIASKLE